MTTLLELRIWLLVAMAMALGACAPLTKVVLLPQADSSSSAVLVRLNKLEQLLNYPYYRATAQDPTDGTFAGDLLNKLYQHATGQDDRDLKFDVVAAAEVQESYPQLYAAMPQRPSKYVLNFMPGGTTLTPESQLLLPTIIEDAAKRSGADMVVTGHTDSMGSLVANDELSLKRARAVVQLLVDQGASRLEAVGRGKRELLVPTGDEVEEPRNRRVEIVVR